ncbi:MAG TPA: tetratricopeptide repeat protein [Thermomicrobiales bacterium]|nr:tetratricopeptide repeat protein [Thermomicrobiales bacterium]
MSLTIAEALQQAQQAIDGGDYGSATTTCAQLVSQFPGYASAHRLLGDAYREQGQPDAAERAFAASLTRNPRHPATCLGLGLIAEDQGANEAALAFCQVAWELAPNQSALREPLTRVSLRRYGSDGELQLTHAALAQMHASASRLRRAVAEYRLALAQLPARVDLQLGLLEALWRLGSESEALQLARGIVEQYPECAPALVILTDLEQRGGNTRRADELLKRLRAVDPDGAIVAGMLPLNARADQQFLSLSPAAMPFLDEAIVIAPERPKIAAAPDFEYRPTRSEIPMPDINELAPMSFEEFGAPTAELAALGIAAAAFSLDDLGDLPEGLQPISIEELGGFADDTATAASFDDGFDFGMASLDTPPETEAPAPFTLEEVLQFESPLAGTEELPEPPPADDRLLFTELVAPAPVAVEPATDTIDDLASLAAALEGDVADALYRAGEPVADVEASRPSEVTPRGYTTVLRGLEDQGLAPFDPRSREPIEGMPSMLSDDTPMFEEIEPVAEVETPDTRELAAQTDEFGKITRDWDTIDDEIQAAMPVESGHGYTDELRSLDEIGLTPFLVEDDDAIEGVSPFNPFASDPIEPPATPLTAPEPVVADAPPATSAAPAAADTLTDELLGGLEPFAFEEFDSGQTPSSDAQSRSFFGQSGWEGSASAVPSDADLDALLAFEDDEEPFSLPDLETSQAAIDALAPAAESTAEVAPETNTSANPFEMPQHSPAPAADFDPFTMPPSLSEADLDEFFESSVAVTRQLPGEADHPMFQAEQPAATQSAAMQPEGTEPQETQVEVTSSQQSLTSALRPDTEVFTRARAVKLGLMSEGRIGGTRELGEGITTDELIAMENRLKTRDLPASSIDAFDDIDDDDDDMIGATGATRDTRTLRAALEVTPDDDELRWWLAEALRDRGDLDDAYTEYRWLIRHAPHRHDQILQALTESVDRDQMPETAHRLLGDIYRRRGDVTRASSHAALALQVRRRSGRVA